MSALVLFLLSLFALAILLRACSDCCGGTAGCTEPNNGFNVGIVSADSDCNGQNAAPSFTFCVWPLVSGSGCSPGGDCSKFANRKFCLKWDGISQWLTDKFTVDCGDTYGTSVDVQWSMIVDDSCYAHLSLNVYTAGSSTVVASVVTYTSQTQVSGSNLWSSGGSITGGLNFLKSDDDGTCSNWPDVISLALFCCNTDCPSTCFSRYLTACNNVSPPSVLYATLNIPSCPLIDGTVVTLYPGNGGVYTNINLGCYWEGQVLLPLSLSGNCYSSPEGSVYGDFECEGVVLNILFGFRQLSNGLSGTFLSAGINLYNADGSFASGCNVPDGDAPLGWGFFLSQPTPAGVNPSQYLTPTADSVDCGPDTYVTFDNIQPLPFQFITGLVDCVYYLTGCNIYSTDSGSITVSN